jgi:5-methylcytosine-specific restriction endonuclease McrA
MSSRRATHLSRRVKPTVPPAVIERLALAEVRRQLVREQKGLCHYCRRPMTAATRNGDDPRSATLDHVVPVADGGDSSPGNLVAACRACNQAKGDNPAAIMRTVG